ncbi:MAG TPA: class I SAM-dependent rRNA methyltransferase [Terracidiphilus sp.]|nr:class I SAM-dependent rRNA methyltransferase [Terracidiphilus sp.]
MAKPQKPRMKESAGKRGAGMYSAREVDAASAGAPGAIVNRRAADRLRGGHLWVYASDLVSVELPGDGAEKLSALLPVADPRGILLGTALYSPTSQIALRMISPEAIGEAEWLKILEARLRRAIGLRKPMLDADNDACRLCFSEADGLPGLITDKYGGLVILQLLAKGLDSAGVREICIRVLREEVSPEGILERPDPRIRELEGLNEPSPGPLWPRDAGAAVTAAQFRLNGLVFQYDADAGQKTGAFLDQRMNYAATQQWARQMGTNGRALDVFCYQGGFALHLAQVCRAVTGVDASRASLEVAERNLEANRGRVKADVDWMEADAFELLRDWSDAGERFDTIVLDPPAFAKTKRAVEGALRGYKELNLRALRMLRPGGLLVTCSCSHHVGWSELESAVASAAADAPRRVRLLERRGAAPDHPVVLNLPETEYLKCLVLEAQ